MSKSPKKKRRAYAKRKEGAHNRRAKKKKALLIISDVTDHVGTVVFLEYFIPHFVEPSPGAAISVLVASILVFVLRLIRKIRE